MAQGGPDKIGVYGLVLVGMPAPRPVSWMQLGGGWYSPVQKLGQLSMADRSRIVKMIVSYDTAGATNTELYFGVSTVRPG